MIHTSNSVDLDMGRMYRRLAWSAQPGTAEKCRHARRSRAISDGRDAWPSATARRRVVSRAAIGPMSAAREEDRAPIVTLDGLA